MQSSFSEPLETYFLVVMKITFYISSDDRETYVSSSTILSLVITFRIIKHTAGISVVRLFFLNIMKFFIP